MGFKTNGYNTVYPPTEQDARRFGEKVSHAYLSCDTNLWTDQSF